MIIAHLSPWQQTWIIFRPSETQLHTLCAHTQLHTLCAVNSVVINNHSLTGLFLHFLSFLWPFSLCLFLLSSLLFFLLLSSFISCFPFALFLPSFLRCWYYLFKVTFPSSFLSLFPFPFLPTLGCVHSFSVCKDKDIYLFRQRRIEGYIFVYFNMNQWIIAHHFLSSIRHSDRSDEQFNMFLLPLIDRETDVPNGRNIYLTVWNKLMI